MNETFMKEKPVLPLLLSMALPNVLSMLVNSLYNIVDSLFVARISEDAMTALSLVFPIQNFSNAIAIGFGIGINAMIALYLGAGDREKAETAATHGFVLSLVHGVVMMVVSIAIMPGFLRRFTQDEALIAAGITYSTIVFLFLVVNMVSLAFEKIFQAVGRMKVSMVALITGCVCNILLDPVLIFGLGPVPAMGIAGAALATGIGQALSVVVYLVVYLRTELPVRLRRRCLRPDAALDGRLYAIGIPAILNLALPSLLVTFLNGLLAAFSQSYVVVLGIYYKLQTFLYLPANGFVQGILIYFVRLQTEQSVDVVVVASTRVGDSPGNDRLELFGQHGFERVREHPDRAFLEHERVAVLDAPGHYLVSGRDVDLHGSVYLAAPHAQMRAPVRVLVALADGLDPLEGVFHAVGDVHGADGGDGLAHRVFVHIHAYHRRVHVHGGPLCDAGHRGDEEAALQNERLGVAALSEPHQKMLEQVHLQELLGLQVAFLGQGLNFALEACIASHHVSTSKYILNSFSTPSALHIRASLGRSAPFLLK